MKNLVLMVVMVLVFSLGLNSGAARAQDETPEVTVAHPLEREITGYEIFAGVTEAAESVELRPRLTSYLVSIHAAEGTAVRRGDMLFQLDPRPFQAALDQGNAEMLRARAQMQFTGASLARAKKLLEAKAMQAEEVLLAEAEHHKSEAGVAAAQARCEGLRLELEYTKIISPIDGRLGRLPVSVGNVVGPETSLGSVVSVAPLRIRFSIDEKTFLAVEGRGRERKAPALQAAFSDEGGLPHACSLAGLDNRFDPQSGTLALRADLAETKRSLLPGISVRVRMSTSEPYRGVVVPDWVISRDATGPYVLVVDDKNVLARQPVTLGPLQDRWQAIKSGLSVKDRIVTAQANEARRDGTKVAPRLVPLAERP